MGVKTYQQVRGDQYDDLVNTTLANYDAEQGIDQTYGLDAGEKKYKISPVLALMREQDKMEQGGINYVQVNYDQLPKSGMFNPAATFTSTGVKKTSSQNYEMGYIVTPVTILGSDLDKQKGDEVKIVNFVQGEMDRADLASAESLAVAVIGDGTNYWDDATQSLLTQSARFQADYLPINGFGFGNSTVTNAILSSTNTYHNLDRATLATYRVKTHAASALTAAGSTDISSLSGLSFDHVSFLVDESYLGNSIYANVVVVGKTLWRRFRALANATHLRMRNERVYELGYDNIEIDGAVIVCDRKFARPNQMFSFNPKYTRLKMERAPYFSTPIKVANMYETYSTNQYIVAQVDAQYPQLHSCIYNIPLT